jgi:hypothetical protein
VGLTIGLANLNISSDADVDVLRKGIYVLIQSAALAFLTSVWGVAFSLGLNFIEKMFERNVLGRIRLLQQRIDFLYPRIPAEQSLVQIADYTRESKAALQELHERIGERLQEAVSGMGEAMQQALAETLNGIMEPAIQALVNNTSQQSTQVLERLVGEFMNGMTAAGREQGTLMQQAAADVNGAVTGMTTQLNELFGELATERERQHQRSTEQQAQLEAQLARMSTGADDRQAAMERRFDDLLSGLGERLKKQLDASAESDQGRQQLFERSLDEAGRRQRELVEQTLNAGAERVGAIVDAVAAQQVQNEQLLIQHRELLDRLREVTEAVSTSSRHMDSSANQLGVLSTNLRDASERMGQRLAQVTQQIEAVGHQNSGVADLLTRQAETMAGLQSALVESAKRFEQAAGLATTGFGAMKETQDAYLASVRKEFTALGGSCQGICRI